MRPLSILVPLVLICPQMGISIAHEDHYKPKRIASPVVTDLDRRLAHTDFELLTQLVLTCPSPLQSESIDVAYADHLLVTGSPDSPRLEELVVRRAMLHRGLTEHHTTIPLIWRESGIVAGDLPTVQITDGLSRQLLLAITNETKDPADLAVGYGAKAGLNFTVYPQRTQLIPVRIWAKEESSKSCEITIASKDEPESRRSVPIKIDVTRPAKLRGRIIDSDLQKVWPGRVYVLGSDGEYRHGGRLAGIAACSQKPLLQFMPVGRSYKLPFFYCDGTFELELPPGPTRITLERGFEHELVHRDVHLKTGEVAEIEISSGRVVNMMDRGWVSGDTHVHWVTNEWNVDLPLDLLSTIQRAEDLRVVNNLTLLHRTENQAFINPSQAPMGPVLKFCNDQFHLQMGEEYRNENLYGHLCFLNLKWLVMPIGTGRYIAGDDTLDYPINKTAILACRQQGGISCEAHGLGGNKDVPVNVVHQLTDSLDQIRPDEYYNFLDCGFHLPLTNGSDHPARVVGSARAYVKVEGDFAYNKWIDGIRRCRTFTSSGPLIFLTVNDAEIGDTLAVSPSSLLSIRAEVISRYPIGRFQVLSNREVLREVVTDELNAKIDFTLPAEESRWVVARCFAGDRAAPAGQELNAVWVPGVAHTSAIYVEVDGKPRFREAAAMLWIHRMREHIRDIKTKGRFASDAQMNEAVGYVEDGIRKFEQLIERHLDGRQQRAGIE